MELMIACMVGLAVGALTLGLTRPSRDPRVVARLDRLRPDRPAGPDADSFARRIIAPVAHRAVKTVTAILPSRILAATEARLETAGRPITVQQFLLVWLGTGLGLPVAAAALAVGLGGHPGSRSLIALVVWGSCGIGLPWLWLRHVAKARSRAIERALPDAVDLMVAIIEAGLGMQAAMLTVADRARGPVAREFGRVVREISIGRTREEALQAMAERARVPELRFFVNAVMQADRTGISVGRILRGYSREMRSRRRLRAREQAGRIPVKITVPTGIFIFPTLLLLVLGPVLLMAVESFRAPHP